MNNVLPLRKNEEVLGFRLKGPGQEKGRIMRWHVISGLCLLNGFRKGAEIGVSQGRFTMFLCAVMHDMEILAVDRWEEKPTRDGEGKQTYEGWDHEGNYTRFKDTCSQYFGDRVSVLRSDSVAGAEHVEDGSLDFVFIDADHTYEGCKADILAWAPKVRVGGMICGHDYSQKWPGVIQAVNELTDKRLISHDSVWVHFKK